MIKESLKEKINNYLEILDKDRYENILEIRSFSACDGKLNKDEIYTKCPEHVKGKVVNCKDYFIGRDYYLYLEKIVKIPAKRANYMPVGLFDFGKTGVNNKYGFEALLYVDGKEYQGIDGNHQEVYFEDLAGKEVRLTFLLWTGLEGGGKKKKQKHFINHAKIAELNLLKDELYYLLKNLLDTLIIIDDKELINTLKKIVLKTIDFNDYTLALNYLKGSLNNLKNNRIETIYICGHSHIDVTWLWRIKHTREKIQRTFSTVLKLIKEYPEFKFIQSQPQLFAFLKKDNPYLFKELKQKINTNLETDGGMWLEADCNLPSGESLVRQFIYGIDFIKKEFNRDCEYLWLPDVFGYSSALPQIMKLCNIKTFMTTKISWNETNEFPYDLFYWQGLDGSKILTYFMNTPNNNVRSVKYGKVSNYSGEIAPMVVYGAWSRFKNKELTKDLLISYGFGDGGGGPTRNMVKNALCIEKIPGLPKIKFAFPSELFNKLHENVKHKKVPVYADELYLELHRATYTTQALSKKYNRQLEYQLLDNEYLSTLKSLNGKKYDYKILNESWINLLQCQFHDNLPGSSIKEVYDDTKIIYENIEKSLNTLEEKNTKHLVDNKKDYYSLYRFSDTNRYENIFVDEKRNGYFIKDNGEIVINQKIKDGHLIILKLEPFKPTIIKFVEGKNKKDSLINVDINNKLIDTPFYKIKWNKRGFIKSIFNKENQKEIIKGEGNILRAYVNRPKLHDAWDIDKDYLKQYDDVIFDDVKLKENGLLRSVIEFKYHFNSSKIVQELIIYAFNPRIDFKTKVLWHEDHRLLRSLFKLNLISDKANYEIQFGHISRNTTNDNSFDEAKFEVCGHKWMDYANEEMGVSLLNDCKYGYSGKKNIIGISLLNSPKYPNPYADMGKHEFTYSLLPHVGPLSLKTIDEAMLLNNKTKVFKGKAKDLRQLIIKDNDNIKIDAIKKSNDDDAYIIHLHEAIGKTNKVKIQSDYLIKKYANCNLLEEYKEIVDKNIINTTFKPFEIKCFKIWL